jgi:hypothetical protein
MKEYPEEVWSMIKVLNEYREIDSPIFNKFDILHMYPQGLAYPDGFHDSRFFELWAFSTRDMVKFKSKRPHDELRFTGHADMDIIRIFADGSTFIRFKTPRQIDCKYQAADVE